MNTWLNGMRINTTFYSTELDNIKISGMILLTECVTYMLLDLTNAVATDALQSVIHKTLHSYTYIKLTAKN